MPLYHLELLNSGDLLYAFRVLSGCCVLAALMCDFSFGIWASLEPSRAAADVNNPIDALHSTDLSLFLRDWTVLETFWIYFARDQNVADTSKALFARILFQEELLLER